VTKLALYGLGNMRDERLGRLFQTPGAVTWCAPGRVCPARRTQHLYAQRVRQARPRRGDSCNARTRQAGAARRVRTATEDGVAASEWLNVFVLHQNRVAHTQSAKNLVKESHLARWLDLVVWGHEHECIPDAQVCGPIAAAEACNGHVASLCKRLQAMSRKEVSTCCNGLSIILWHQTAQWGAPCASLATTWRLVSAYLPCSRVQPRGRVCHFQGIYLPPT